MSTQLRCPRLWQGLGWALVVAVVAGSLLRLDVPFSAQGGDKLHHLLAYGALMYWWGMLQSRRQAAVALLLAALGATLEGAQALVPHRSMEWRDALANATGILLALGLLRTRASGLLARLDRLLGDRLDARQP